MEHYLHLPSYTGKVGRVGHMGGSLGLSAATQWKDKEGSLQNALLNLNDLGSSYCQNCTIQSELDIISAQPSFGGPAVNGNVQGD